VDREPIVMDLAGGWFTELPTQQDGHLTNLFHRLRLGGGSKWKGFSQVSLEPCQPLQRRLDLVQPLFQILHRRGIRNPHVVRRAKPFTRDQCHFCFL
jgi:hypothetical protein